MLFRLLRKFLNITDVCICLLKIQFKKKQDFVVRLPIKAQIRTERNVKCIHTIKCVKVRALFAKNKVRFARAEQLRSLLISVTH